jgi:hypothetical protein
MMLVAGKGNNIIYYQSVMAFFSTPGYVFLPFGDITGTEGRDKMVTSCQ